MMTYDWEYFAAVIVCSLSFIGFAVALAYATLWFRHKAYGLKGETLAEFEARMHAWESIERQNPGMQRAPKLDDAIKMYGIPEGESLDITGAMQHEEQE